MRLRPVVPVLLCYFVYPEEGDYRVYQNSGATEIWHSHTKKSWS